MSIHEHLCAAYSGIASFCRPPFLRNAFGCRLQTAFHILTPSNSLQWQKSSNICAICYTVLRCLSKVLLRFGCLPKVGLKDICEMHLAVLIDV